MAKGSLAHPQQETGPRVRRGYFESRYGQLHVHNAIPAGGGFEEGTPLLCLHHVSATGREFERFLTFAGRDRSVYAPDMPGFGESDGPPGPLSIVEYAAAIGDFLEAMRFRQIDVLGHQSGSLLAAELAVTRPQQIRRLVLVSVPAAKTGDRDTANRPDAQAAPDGSALQSAWQANSEWYGPAVPAEFRARAFAERIKHGTHMSRALAATQQYPAAQRLSLITQPTLVLRPRDEFWDATARVRDVLPKSRMVDLPEQGNGLFAATPESVVGYMRDFLRG